MPLHSPGHNPIIFRYLFRYSLSMITAVGKWILMYSTRRLEFKIHQPPSNCHITSSYNHAVLIGNVRRIGGNPITYYDRCRQPLSDIVSCGFHIAVNLIRSRILAANHFLESNP